MPRILVGDNYRIDYPKLAFWILALVLSVIWWRWASQGSSTRLIMTVSASLASFAVGCLAGFLFTSYGEEASTVGKVRDWLIAGISGLTFAQVIDKDSALKHMFLAFAAGPGPNEYALVVGSTILFSVLGFFFMFFQRELGLNVQLAKSRSLRLQFEASRQAGQVTQRLLIQLPPSLLSGVDDINEIVQVNKALAEGLEKLLFSAEVDKFLEEAEASLREGVGLEWDIVFRTAHLHYYRIYFEKDQKRELEIKSASEWILRALTVNPKHIDLTMKYADVLNMARSYAEAVAVLEKVVAWPEAPVIVKQWLGAFLLRMPDRLDRAIFYSETYLKEFPQDNDAWINVARGYAQKYCAELSVKKKTAEPDSEDRKKALSNLGELLRRRPDYAERVKTKWIGKGRSFDCLVLDQQFRELIGLLTPTGTAGGGTGPPQTAERPKSS